MSTRIAQNITDAYAELRMQIAQRLLVAAVTVVVQHQHNLNRSNPRPYLDSSKPGEFPRKRTGFLQANVGYYPVSPIEVARDGFVDVGYTEGGFYGEALVNMGRKGIEDTVEELRPQLEAIIAGGKQ